MERKSSTQSVCFAYPMFVNCVHVFQRCCVHNWSIFQNTEVFTWTLRMLYQKLWWIFLTRSPKNFRSNSEKIYKFIFFFKKKCFPQKIPLDTWNAVLTALLKNFAKSPIKFTQSPKKIIKLLCLQKFFSSKSSSGHVECNFDNSAENVGMLKVGK